MNLKPRDRLRLLALRNSAEHRPYVPDASEEAEDAAMFRELAGTGQRQPSGMVSMEVSPAMVPKMTERIKDGIADLAYGIRVIYTVGADYRQLSMSRNGKPDIPRSMQTQILNAFDFPRDTELGKNGRALHAIAPFTLPLDA